MNLRGDILTQRCNYILDSPILSNLILCLVAWSLIQGSCNSRLCQCDIVSHPTKHLRAGPSQKIKKTLNTCGRGPPGIYIYTCELASCACRLVIFYFLLGLRRPWSGRRYNYTSLTSSITGCEKYSCSVCSSGRSQSF